MQLCKKLPPHSCWVEAFCGSAALTFAKEPAPIEVINDINDNIINVFKQLRENHDDLVNKIQRAGKQAYLMARSYGVSS